MRVATFLGLTAFAAVLAGCAARLPAVPGPSPLEVGSYLQGARAELGGQFQTAQRNYLAALTDNPDNLMLRQRVFQMSLLDGDVPTAARLAKTLPPDLQHQTMPQLVLMVDAVRRGQLDLAAAHLASAATLAPDLLHFQVMQSYLDLAGGVSPSAVIGRLQGLKVPAGLESRRAYQVGKIELEAGDAAAAQTALERAQQLDPGTVFTTRLLGELYERQGQAAKAVEVYRTFRRHNPNVPLFGAALRRVARRQAPPPFVHDLASDLGEVSFDFGLLLWAQGANGPARQVLNLTLWLTDGRDPYALYYSALISELGDQSGLARKRYAALLDDPRLAAAAAVRLAQMDEAAGHKAEARQRLEALARRAPDEPVVERALADLAFADKNYAEALPHYRKLTAHLEDVEPAQQLALLFAEGACLERLGRYDEAGTVLLKALAVDPASAQVLNYLGYMWVEHGLHVPEATVLLQRAHLLAPQDGAVTDSLGWAYAVQGKNDIALKYLEAAAEQEPDDATVNNHLGDVYARLGRLREARAQWRVALRMVKPDDDPGLAAAIAAKLNAQPQDAE
jgi:tetratricopeptide (TPR) repeat protein